jgi:hypothetical protein
MKLPVALIDWKTNQKKFNRRPDKSQPGVPFLIVLQESFCSSLKITPNEVAR